MSGQFHARRWEGHDCIGGGAFQTWAFFVQLT
jgi:hypothetical protein